VIAAGHKQAKCSVPLKEVLQPGEGPDLGRGLKLVEIYSWRAAYNFGSILFVVPAKQPGAGRLLRFPEWDHHKNKIGYSYSLSSPGYDPDTKKLGAGHKLRGASDCGNRMALDRKGLQTVEIMVQGGVRRREPGR
jgi:hypothetical protein